ncbi:Hypothetical predicted protein [Mytilus galloprovincialis]|uniref:F5/8 type C domain-containing protein n=1 Tax=Mytilus galloprovincialis TaxID=29158 RepID=A0A8B6DZG6_MYTGA|nr:Hypothetical predicted protein [Mytilus galloprovincialis]
MILGYKEFIANTDDKTKVTNKFGCPVFAKCVRVYPSDWHNHSGLRFDLIGCEIIDGPHPNVTLQKTTSGSSTSISTSSKRPNITTASTTLTSTKTTTASPLTTPNPKFTQSTTIKPTALLPITHKIFPTGQASNYNTRDPLDCKRALLVDPCTNPIVNKHCFYSCNPKQGNNLLSSTNTIPFRQTTTITSKQTIGTPVAVSNVQTTHTSSISTHMSAANINVSPSQTSLNNMLSLHSNTMYNSLSTIQSTPTSMLPSSISIGVTSLKHSNILHSSMTTQNTIKSSSISPMSTAIASISITPTNAVSSSATHNVLPTGQASIYNSLDPKDCKRSLLMFSCAVPIVAKHCHYSCSKPSSKLLSSSMFHSSVSVVAHSQNSDKTSIISQTSFLNGIQSTQLSQTQLNPSKPITNLFTTMNQNSNQINPSSLTSAMFSVTSMVNPSVIVHSNSAIISPSINSNPSLIMLSSTTSHTSTAQSSNSNMAQMSRYSQASGSVTISMIQSSIPSKPLSVTGLTGIQTTVLQSALKDSSVTSAMMTTSMHKGSFITQYSSSLSSLPSSAVLQNVQSSDKPSSTVVNLSSVLHQHYLNSLNINPPSSIIKTTQISSLPSSGVPSSLLYQSASKTGSYSSVPQSLLTSSMQASSVTSLTSPMQASSATSLTSPMQASSVTSLTSPIQASSVTSLTSSMQASSVTSLTSSMQASSVTSLTSPMQASSVTSLTSSMQASSVTSLTSSMQASSVTSLTLSMHASSVTSLSSGVTGIFTSSVIKGSSYIQSVSGNFVSSFSSVGITSSITIGSSSLLGKGNPAISTTYASSGQYTSVVSAINSLLPVQSSNILRSQFVTNSFLQSSVSSPSITASVFLSQSGIRQLTSSIVQSSPPLSSVQLLSTVPLLHSSNVRSGYQSSLGHLSSLQSLSVLNPGMTSVLSSQNTNKIPVSSGQNQGLTSVPSSLNQDSSLFQIPTKSSIFASLNPSAPLGLSSKISDLSVLFSSPNHAMSSAISSVHPIMLSVPSSLNTDMVSASSKHIMSPALSNINPSMSSAPLSIIQSMNAASSTLNQGRIFIPSSLNPSMSSELSNINSGMASASLSLKSGGISTPLSTSPSISFAQSNINPSKLSTQFSISPGMSYTTSIKNSVMSLSTSNINTVSLSSSIPTASLSSSNGPLTMSIIPSGAYQSVAMLSINTLIGSYSASRSTSANSVMISLNAHASVSSKSLSTSLSTSVPSLIDSVTSIDSSTQLPSSLLLSSDISTSPFWASMQSVQSSVPLTSFGDVSSSYETTVSFIGYQATAMPFLSTSVSSNSKQMSLTCVPLSSELSLTISDSSNIPLFSMSSSIIVSSGEHSRDLISASDISLSHGYSPVSSAVVSMTCYNIPVMYSNAMSSALQSVTPTLPSVQTLQTTKAFGSSVFPTNLPISHTISHSMPQPSVSILQTSTQTSKITTPASKQLPTTKHVTNVILPTGVASIYNSLDPIDCKRSLNMFSCSMSIVAKHCFYSCRKQNSTTVHPISPGKLSLPTGSSTMAKSKIIFQSLTATFSKAMSNFSTSKKPNLSKFTHSSKSIQKSTSTTKPLTFMQTTKPSTISSTTKPSTISSTTKPLTSMSTPSSTTKTTTRHIKNTVRSLYDNRDPQNCMQLITWIQCTDFYYGKVCKYSCVNKKNAIG